MLRRLTSRTEEQTRRVSGRFPRSVFIAVPLLLTACAGATNEEDSAQSSELGRVGSETAALRQAPLGELLPTGARITPMAAPSATLTRLNPHLPSTPDYVADHAVTTVLSPDGTTLLVLTSGYNRLNGPTGSRLAEASNEYVFVFDVSKGIAVEKQVLTVPNTFTGIAWHPSGGEFYVAGGVDDNLRFFRLAAGVFVDDGVVAFGHTFTNGLLTPPAAAGVAVNESGTRAVVANYQNDSISVVDLATRTLVGELDLRPGKVDPAESGIAGGEYPSWVVIQGDSTAYVSSQRDHEVVVVDLTAAALGVVTRIAVGGQPGRMLLDKSATHLFVANANSDSVSVIDTEKLEVVEAIRTTAPRDVFRPGSNYRGASPNSLALSPDEKTLYVTNAGTNSLAVIRLADDNTKRGWRGDRDGNDESEVIGLIPTGWYPSSVSVSADGKQLYVVNSKDNPGPNPLGCRNTTSIAAGSLNACRAGNQYVWQLEKASFLSLPVPGERELEKLTAQVAENNSFPSAHGNQQSRRVFRELRKHVKHVIYVIKENRTYDQMFGDLQDADGDPTLNLFPEPVSPNHHALAKNFVTLDHFFDSGETSGVGWNWTLAARTTDSIEKTQPPNYAGRGFAYDWEGTNRNINVGIPTLTGRLEAFPYTPMDPDILPGTRDVASHVIEDEEGPAGYLWEAALERGLSVRNYGCFGDLSRYFLAASDPAFIPLEREPFLTGSLQFVAAKESLIEVSDPYFRGYDMKYPDYFRYKEWEREFDDYVANGNLPNLQLVRLPRDHFGDFAAAIDGTNTVDTQMADNDYAVGLLVEKVAQSPYRDGTLIFVIEDDAQDGADHIDPHRSIGLIAGPFVKQGAVISTPYTTVSMVRTIEEILDLEPMGLTDGLAEPMLDVFDLSLQDEPWRYDAIVPEVLRTTTLPLPAPSLASVELASVSLEVELFSTPRQTAEYWAAAMQGQNFEREDDLDTDHFNQALFKGLMGADQPRAR